MTYDSIARQASRRLPILRPLLALLAACRIPAPLLARPAAAPLPTVDEGRGVLLGEDADRAGTAGDALDARVGAIAAACAEWSVSDGELRADAGSLGNSERVTIEEAFNAADDGGSLSASRGALSQFSVSDVFGLQKCEDDQGEQLHLVLTVVRKVSGETTRQLV